MNRLEKMGEQLIGKIIGADLISAEDKNLIVWDKKSAAVLGSWIKEMADEKMKELFTKGFDFGYTARDSSEFQLEHYRDHLKKYYDQMFSEEVK